MGLRKLKYYKMILLCCLISGCLSQETMIKKDEQQITFSEQYQRSIKIKENLNVKEQLQWKEDLDIKTPYMPVILPPKVIKVWIPSQRAKKDRSVLIGGHWMFMMIKDADWFIDHDMKEPYPQVLNIPMIDVKEE